MQTNQEENAKSLTPQERRALFLSPETMAKRRAARSLSPAEQAAAFRQAALWWAGRWTDIPEEQAAHVERMVECCDCAN